MSKTINDLEKMLDKDMEASSLSGKPKPVVVIAELQQQLVASTEQVVATH